MTWLKVPHVRADLGIQATQLIRDAEEPLSALKHLTQNFPKYAASLARRVSVDKEVLQETELNLLQTHPGVNSLWLNGLQVMERDMNPFACV